MNAFFALMFDNVANLVILVAILVGAFHFPKDVVLHRIVPGTAVGVLVGDLIYAWMARRLARRTGRGDVTAMPLGLNAPSVFGISFAVLGPAFLATGDAVLAWKIGMAVTVLVGLFKMGLSFSGNAVRSALPRAGLLGSIAGAGLALIAFLPFLKVVGNPIVGFVALGVILLTFVAGVRLPWGLPGAFVSAIVAVGLHYLLIALGFGSAGATAPAAAAELRLAVPWPSLDFLDGLSRAWFYLPIAMPFAVMTIIGGIDNTESAAAAGDEYDTRGILATEGFCTLVAGLCGGVVESTPYIGHPAFKKMGAGAGYAVATALFVGLGGMLGYLPFLVDWIPAAAVAPILIYVGLEVVAQGVLATPHRHAPAVALAILPAIGFLVSLEMGSLIAAAGPALANLTGEVADTFRAARLLGNGFIVTALLWGGAAAELIDHRFRRSALYFFVGALLCLFGVIHSPTAQGTFFLPWKIADSTPLTFAGAYAAVGLLVLAAALPKGPLSSRSIR
ncbi:MAG TPA: MFS transporter [Thermoanaerobaculia bacterium]|nr:MFS transporter [Thermoanaerobaculia bacterium]